MKVAIVCPVQFGPQGRFGGGERYALNLAKALANFVDTRLVTTGSQRRTTTDGSLVIEEHRAIRNHSPDGFNPVMLGFLKSLSDVDVIHCVAYGNVMSDLSIAYGRLTRKRVFITDVGGRGRTISTKCIDLSRFSNGLLLLSRFAEKAFQGHRPRRSIIYGGVDVVCDPIAVEHRERRVAFVGRLLPHKGIDYFIAGLPANVPAIILGRPYHAQYWTLLQRLAVGRDVTFVVDADDERVRQEVRLSAAAILPSVYQDVYGGRHPLTELLGLAALEAMAAGTPIIASSVGSLPEVVEDGRTGLLVPPNNSDAIAKAIDRVLSDTSFAASLASAGRAHVLRRFTWDAVAERCLDAYDGAG